MMVSAGEQMPDMPDGSPSDLTAADACNAFYNARWELSQRISVACRCFCFSAH